MTHTERRHRVPRGPGRSARRARPIVALALLAACATVGPARADDAHAPTGRVERSHEFVQVLSAPASGAGSPATSPATAPTTGPTAEVERRVVALLNTLVTGAPAERDDAERQLATFGADVLPTLRAARDGTLAGVPALTADARARVEAVLASTLDDIESGPSRITLDVTDVPIEQVIKEINRQARSNLLPPQAEFGNVKKKVTLSLNRVSFFEALDAFQKASNLTFQPQNEGWRAFPGQMNFGNGEDSEQRFDSGAFRITAQSATYTSTVSYARNQGDSDNFYFNFNGRAEPKIRTNEGQVQVVLDEARDDKGNDLSGAAGGSNAYNQGFGIFNGNLQLRYPKDPGQKIAVLKGRLKLSIVKSWDIIEVPDVMAGRSVRAYEGINITFDRATTDDAGGARGQVSIKATIPWNGNGRTLNAVQRAMQRVKLVDANGTPFDSAGMDNNFEGQTMRYTLRFTPNGGTEAKPPFKLQIEAPKDTRDVDVPFEFRDLKMPQGGARQP